MLTTSSNPSKAPSAKSQDPGGGALEKAVVPSSERKKELHTFERALNIHFHTISLLNLAFIHRSVSNENGSKLNNERLEFLGDAVLGVAAATLLYKELPEQAEGFLAKVKSVVVSEDILSGIAREIQRDNYLILGHGEEQSGGRAKKAILADALEAVFGALYLDNGYNAAFNLISRLLRPEIARVLQKGYVHDYKSRLQEACQKRFKCCPQYNLVRRSGPEHDRSFWVEVEINGQKYGPGTGKNKKSAEQDAARLAYEALNQC
jgi:ribonuclease-3